MEMTTTALQYQHENWLKEIHHIAQEEFESVQSHNGGILRILMSLTKRAKVLKAKLKERNKNEC